MHLETLLPLGKVDPGLRAPDRTLDLAAVAADAALLEGSATAGSSSRRPRTTRSS